MKDGDNNIPEVTRPSEVLRRGYSDEEAANIYELGRQQLENGQVRAAEAIFMGLTEVVPDFAPAWLGAAYVAIQAKNYDLAINAARQALRLDSNFTAALLYLVPCLIETGDIHTAGTHLGEVGERIGSGAVSDPNIIRFYKAQLARFQNR